MQCFRLVLTTDARGGGDIVDQTACQEQADQACKGHRSGVKVGRVVHHLNPRDTE